MASTQPETAERVLSKTKSDVVREAQRLELTAKEYAEGHWAAARFWGKFHLWIGIPMVLLSSIAGAAALSRYDEEHVISGVLSILVAALSGVVTFLNPNEKVLAHQAAGNSHDALASSVRLFWAIECWGDESEGILTENLRRFSEQKNELNKNSPTIPTWAVEAARRALRGKESLE